MNKSISNIRFFAQRVLLFFILFYILIIPSSACIAYNPDTLNTRNVYESFMNYVYDFSFNAADSILLNLDIKSDDETVISTMKSKYSWWAILSEYKVDENIGICKAQTDKTIDYLSKLENPDIDQQLDLIEAYILKVRLDNYTHSKVGVIPLLFRTLNRIKGLLKNDELTDRKLLVLGLYYYFVDYVEAKYLFAGTILKRYPNGDRALGLKYLHDCRNSNDHMVKVEANYFLYKIYFSIEEDYISAYENIRFLHSYYPNNIVFSYELYKTMKKNKDADSDFFKQKILEQINSSNSLVYSQKMHFKDLFASD